MTGLFDDLIPADGPQAAAPAPTPVAAAPPAPAAAAPAALTFDDLIPAKPTKPAAQKRSLMDNVGGFMANVNRGLGVGDEIAAGLGTARDILSGKVNLVGAGQAATAALEMNPELARLAAEKSGLTKSFDDNLAAQRGMEDSFSAAHPNVAAVARGSGNAMTMAAPVGPGAEAFATGGRAVNALRGATLAGLTGAGYAAVDRGTPEERLHAAEAAAIDPVTLGLGGAGGSLATVRPRAVRAEAPSLEELTTAKNAAYKAVDDSGVRYAPEAMQGLSSDINSALAAARFNPNLHTKAAPILDQIAEDVNRVTGYSPTLTELDQLRRQVRASVGSSADADERRIGGVILGRIDNFINTAGPEAIVGGDPQHGAALIANARALNTRVEKLRSLDNLDEAATDRAGATGTGANTGNALRQNIIRFQRDTKNLTPDEQAATRLAIRGGGGQNALRAVGSLSPEGGTVRAATSIATGAMSHGTIPAVGYVAKRVSDALAERNVQALRDLIASGGEATTEVSRQLADPAYAELRAQLANDLAVQAGVQSTARRGSVTAEVEGQPAYGTGASRR